MRSVPVDTQGAWNLRAALPVFAIQPCGATPLYGERCEWNLTNLTDRGNRVISELQHHLPPCHIKFADMADREVVERAQRGDETASEFLLYKYRNLVRTKVKSYFLVGAEKEDLLQVGMIGLWQAIVDFRCDRAISFPAFAKVCIQRHIITAIKTATRQKQMPLNTSLSLESPSEDSGPDWNLSDILPSTEMQDPEEMLLRGEDTRRLHENLQNMLSEFEWRV